MSYESQIYIVMPNRGDLPGHCGLDFAEKIAIFRLGCIDGMYEFAQCYPESSCYIYADDGDTEITRDRYGDRLREIPIRELIFQLVRYNSEYKRWDISAVIAALLHYADGPGKLVALHYGY